MRERMRTDAKRCLSKLPLQLCVPACTTPPPAPSSRCMDPRTGALSANAMSCQDTSSVEQCKTSYPMGPVGSPSFRPVECDNACMFSYKLGVSPSTFHYHQKGQQNLKKYRKSISARGRRKRAWIKQKKSAKHLAFRSKTLNYYKDGNNPPPHDRLLNLSD